VLCDEHGIGGDGEYCGNNDAQLDRINVFFHEASGGMYILRAVFFNLKPGVIDAVRASPLSELFRPGNLVTHARTVLPAALASVPFGLVLVRVFLTIFVVNSEPHTGERPSVRLCVGPELARCDHKYGSDSHPSHSRGRLRGG
jgi:hypothetical protein